jgi:hypothetical protein
MCQAICWSQERGSDKAWLFWVWQNLGKVNHQPFDVMSESFPIVLLTLVHSKRRSCLLQNNVPVISVLFLCLFFTSCIIFIVLLMSNR